MKKLTSVRFWLHGLVAAAIGGGSNAVTLVVVDPLKFNLAGGWQNLAAAAAVSAVVSAALYLKQSPLPAEPVDDDKPGA